MDDVTIRDEIEALADKAEAVAPKAEAPPITPVMVNLADVTPRPVEWLWHGRIALGKVTLLAGDPGLGKSFVTLDLAARVSRGSSWPDAPNVSAPLGGVVLLSAEDDLEDTIRPRLDAAGADVTRISALAAVRHNYRDNATDAAFCLATDLAALEAAILATRDCKLVIIDPITAYLGDADSHKNAEIRGLIAPLAKLAEKHKVAVVCVTHLNKGAKGTAVYRAIGSIAFAAAARAMWVVTKDPENALRRLMLPAKNNLAPDSLGLAYTIEAYGDAGGPVVAWEADPVNVSADDLLNAQGDQDEADDDGDQAKAWLREALKDGPMPAQTVLDQGKANGFSNRVVRRAFHDLGGQRRKADFKGGWLWWLPGSEDASPSTGESSASSESSQKHGESSSQANSEDAQHFQVFHEDSQDAQDSDDGWGIVA